MRVDAIDTTIQRMVLSRQMNDVQAKIAELQAKRWTLAAIADEIGVKPNAVEKWKAGTRYPRPDKPIIDALARVVKRKRIPKMRRYK